MAARLDMNLNGLDLLIVEDDAASALFTSQALCKYGARVDIANDGAEGLRKYLEKRYPIIITDINMPGMSGLELVTQIKAHDKDAQVVATSANRESDCLVSAISLGFSEYFFKPIVIEKLLLAVKRCSDVITARRQLESEQAKFRTVLECLNDGIAIKDLDYKIQYQNSALTRLFGDLAGLACYEIFGLNEPCEDCPTIQTLADGQPHSACRDYHNNGTTVHVESTASLLKDSSGAITGTVEIFRNITDRVKHERAIRDIAFLDPLTGLSNRRLFEDRLEQEIAKASRYGTKFGLFYLDLDNFKYINDTFGHKAGDQVLVDAAGKIKSCCRRDLDTISRLGGDEFCIIFTDCGDREQLTAIAQKLLAQFARPFQLGNSLTVTTVSIGISIFPDNGAVRKELEIAADRAMYAAKKAGRNNFCLWEVCENWRTRE